MRKRIALVVYYHKTNKYSFNALIGALETDSVIKYLDIYFIRDEDELLEQIEGIISGSDKVLMAFSFFTTQLWEINDLITLIREKYGNKLFLLAGGPHPTGDPQGTLDLGFDLVGIGEGEETLIDIMRNFSEDKELRSIKGVAFLDDDGNFVITGKREPIDLSKYPPFPLKSFHFGPIEITRGCPYVCYFCQTPYILGAKPRHRSIDSVLKYIRIMKRENLSDIRFITPNAFSYGSTDGKELSLPKLEELLKKIKDIIGSNGRIFLGSFPSEVRPEHVTKETLALILKYADNDNIIIGAQSGSQKILNLCHRSHTVEDVHKAVDLTLNAKLKANVDFIFGLPNESDEDIRLSIEMMRDLVKKGARIHTHSFIPLPQTPFSKESATQINDKFKDAIEEITSMGGAFGDWQSQERLAIKITKYLKTKKIG